jgi:hypothetical protein
MGHPQQSSLKTTEFVVAPSEELALEHVLNYPNPFTTHTEFYFEHNRPVPASRYRCRCSPSAVAS